MRISGRYSVSEKGSSVTEPICQYLRSNYLSNRVFKDYTAIVDAACDAWNALIDTPQIITSIGIREWAHV